MVRVKKETPAAQGMPRPAKTIAATDTQREAYARTAPLRETELQRARAFFRWHPRQAYSRARLCDELGLPINHITRIVYDLKEADFIESAGRALNPHSNISVEVVRLKEKGGGDE